MMDELRVRQAASGDGTLLAEAELEMAGSLTDARVLLADPSDTLAGKVRSYLGEDGHQTPHVQSGGEALALAQSAPFDLLIVLLHLGHEHGLRLRSPFRSAAPPRHVPIPPLPDEDAWQGAGKGGRWA